ncbi:MAG: methylenetetrahydrofolate--tRNA-(uracil(54)-C(5))-methyltransferase (FADH(2)-oxidizing) TrmFO [Candidatus Coatesbacteria bacterium]|nr:MAG: methylenetetrahydrofolate--tRNA-(uracil(54)-C(5))-methyltransferase (FADH(2)-oxidizing) TrmFO [Candidatus Coatesbacteria bacterium]
MKGEIEINVIGGGLAGVEAARAISNAGLHARLYEMRPAVTTPAHATGLLGELVCSNSLKSDVEGTASGLLKAEMRLLGSAVLDAAEKHRVPAGSALAVDRTAFAEELTATVESDPNIELVREEVVEIPDGTTVVATGPLTSGRFAEALHETLGTEQLYFYDAIAPVIEAGSIDMGAAFPAARYDKGEGDYVNCPLNAEEYRAFVGELAAAETAELKDFEEGLFFEGCVPIEELARRGLDTLRFGPFKPVGLVDPQTGERPYAVVQLRAEDAAGNYLGMVGCQTRLKYAEQERVFRMVPALANARFIRLGSAHRNTYVNGPTCLAPTLEALRRPGFFVAGQLTGVEGYVESAATGIIAGTNAARVTAGRRPIYPPADTMIGSLLRYVTTGRHDAFVPANASYGIMPPAPPEHKGKQAKAKYRRKTGLASLEIWLAGVKQE